MQVTKRFLLGVLMSGVSSLAAQEPFQGIRINEFLARGAGDEWVEIHNSTDEPVDLGGCFLTDSTDDRAKYPLTDITLEPGGFIVVTPAFRLSGEGEYLALMAPDRKSEIDALAPTYPPQHPNVSYGITISGEWAYYEQPTPGRANGEGFKGVCESPVPSVARGFKKDPFNVSLAGDAAAEIRYTLDGSTPSADHGQIYRREIPITTTTMLRTMALREGHLPSTVATHSYLFLNDVVSQPAQQKGFPKNWGRDRQQGVTVPGNYAMDPRVTKTTLPGYGMEEALTDLPTVSVVMPVKDLFESRTGIYANPLSRGVEWERAMSMEWIDPDGDRGFQVNAGIRMQGNSSRRPARMQKHSFRIDFQSQYGVSKLRFPVFEHSPVRSFNKLVLRTPSTDSWGLVGWMENRYRPNDSQYVRDVWMKESLRAMGHPSGRSRFVHLYLNGLYWGIYILAERLDEDFFASHLGGRPEEWDVIRDFSETLAGDQTQWRALISAAEDARDPETYARFLMESPPVDLDNLIDYTLLHFLADAEDWPHHNYYAAAGRDGAHPFRFLVWDQEIVLDNHAMDRMNSREPGPAQIFHGLMSNAQFRYRFADRAHRHLSPGGALSLEACQERYRAIAQIIDKAIVAESARWGDTAHETPYGNPIEFPRDPGNARDPNFPMPANRRSPYMTRESSWLVERDHVLNTYLPALYDHNQPSSVVFKLRQNRLIPKLDAPILTRKENEGDGITWNLSHSNTSGILYFTLDGSDPRPAQSVGELVDFVPSGALKRALLPTDAGLEGTWLKVDFDDSEWPAGTKAAGYEMSRTGEYILLLDHRLNFSRVVSPRKNETIYLRASFHVDNPKSFAQLVLKMRYDDGFVAYLNGNEIARANVREARPTWRSVSSATRRDTQATAFEIFDLNDAARFLIEGKNVLAVHALNDDSGSSDFLIHPILQGAKRRQATGEDPSSATRYMKPVAVTGHATLRAAVESNGEWSAVVRDDFHPVIPAGKGNLIISEIFYDPLADEELEFIELHNVSNIHAIDLEGVAVKEGIRFTLPALTLSPRECVVVARDESAFQKTYGTGVKIGGTFQGKLSDQGEEVQLLDSQGRIIETVHYRNEPPWPNVRRGGFSLERAMPPGDPSASSNWHASLYEGGSPGAAKR